MIMPPEPATILVTGATGYIGGRLAPRLLAQGYTVRVLARDPRRLGGLAAAGAVCVEGDVLRPETLAPALAGVDVAYYLIHSMEAGPDFAARDREAAANFAAACAAAGVRRIIYLGGLGRPGPSLSSTSRVARKSGTSCAPGPCR